MLPPPKSWFHDDMAQAFWPHRPVILEHEHLGLSQGRKAWSGALIEKAVEDYHAAYLSIHWWPRELLAESRDAIERINRRLGCRIQLKEGSIGLPEPPPKHAHAGGRSGRLAAISRDLRPLSFRPPLPCRRSGPSTPR